jgi:hypothetical protein
VGHYNSFLLRIWTEERNDEVRGSIQHVGTQESIYFTSWDKMVDFINNHLSWRINPDIPENKELQRLDTEAVEQG